MDDQSQNEEIKQIQKVLGVILDTTTDGIWTWNFTTSVMTFSPRYYTMLGYEPDAFSATYENWLNLIHPDDRQQAKAVADHFLETKSIVYHNVFRLRTKSGDYRWIRSRGKVVERDESGDILLMIGNHEDITEQKIAEIKMEESQKKYAAFFHTNPAGLAITSLKDGRVIEVNESMAGFCGYTCSECIGKTSLELGFWAEPVERENFVAALSKGVPLRNRHMTYLNRAGERRESILSAEVLTLDGEQCIMTAMFDITEFEKSSQALKSIKSRNEAMISVMPDLLFMISRDYRFVECHASDPADFILPREKLVGRTLRQRLPLDLAILNEQYVDRTLEMRKRHQYQLNLDVEGTLRTFEARMVPCDEEHVVAILKDISSDVKMEERLNQAQKMEAIGTLAGGIAHDFNNILSPMLGYAELIEMVPNDQTIIQNGIKEISKAGIRAKELINQILSFSRTRQQPVAPIYLHTIIKECLKLLRSSIPTTIDIRKNIDEKCGAVMADPTRVHQIIMNLATNAFHAMEDNGGVLEIIYKCVDVKTENRHLPEMLPGRYVTIVVRDTGTGIEKGLQQKIFEPYFTTKTQEKGTGLGLSMVNSIVKSMSGYITVESDIGKGASFYIYFPVAEKPQLELPSERKVNPVRGNGERILLVDDDPAITKMMKSLLNLLGYRMTAMESPVEALKVFSQSPQSFDLLVTDMTMPQMTGLQLLKNIREIRPELPVIVASGFNTQINEKRCREYNIQCYMKKPYTIDEISEKIKLILT
ncbi:putative Histidine kinase [Desulfamplus magnetovallimortis]|uniref:histidine kinase n=1 Tax=Desulfamplus magnetovallimortis TaxID=1246637 RepID=A0A1W1HGF5_9BACT|nr:PAS domain S-box protein [Desulfamplus magnetovallimortis]SLM31503.1 putative Histidine kinase [Desulfamplus magnetovallimortis]